MIEECPSCGNKWGCDCSRLEKGLDVVVPRKLMEWVKEMRDAFREHAWVDEDDWKYFGDKLNRILGEGNEL